MLSYSFLYWLPYRRNEIIYDFFWYIQPLTSI